MVGFRVQGLGLRVYGSGLCSGDRHFAMRLRRGLPPFGVYADIMSGSGLWVFRVQ